MSFILVYEPKEGLRYWVQKVETEYRLNGLRENAKTFYTYAGALEIKERMSYLIPEVKIETV